MHREICEGMKTRFIVINCKSDILRKGTPVHHATVGIRTVHNTGAGHALKSRSQNYLQGQYVQFSIGISSNVGRQQ